MTESKLSKLDTEKILEIHAFVASSKDVILGLREEMVTLRKAIEEMPNEFKKMVCPCPMVERHEIELKSIRKLINQLGV